MSVNHVISAFTEKPDIFQLYSKCPVQWDMNSQGFTHTTWKKDRGVLLWHVYSFVTIDTSYMAAVIYFIAKLLCKFGHPLDDLTSIVIALLSGLFNFYGFVMHVMITKHGVGGASGWNGFRKVEERIMVWSWGAL